LIKRYVELDLELQVIAVTLTVVVVDGLFFVLDPVQGADIDTVDEYAGPVNNQNCPSL